MAKTLYRPYGIFSFFSPKREAENRWKKALTEGSRSEGEISGPDEDDDGPDEFVTANMVQISSETSKEIVVARTNKKRL